VAAAAPTLARLVLQNPSGFCSTIDVSTRCSFRTEFSPIWIARFANKTIVFVSHRISALKWGDRIVVLNGGIVEEQGTLID